MTKFDTLWRLVVVGFLLIITISITQIKLNIKTIETLLFVPDIELPESEQCLTNE